ncbi:MAG: NAD-dependent epimerase/dehydratase family protein [Candidatus Thermoplasmatota archaeon]|nr:NAD-dependent epimerase/dehydratase family protein [Candidatus Thermoplasmatota archaeon]
MKILVTGHKGFIGSQVYSNLESNGFDVTGIDLGDEITDEKYDYIVHMGARTLIRKSREKPFEYFSDNMVLSLRMLEISRKHGSVIIYPTSGSVSEATNPYSLAKKQIVEWIELYRNLYGIRRHVLKFYNIYGPTSRKGAVYLFCNAALNDLPAVIYGDGSHIRDFIHVEDAVRTIRMIIDGKIPEGHHEVGSGRGTSVMQLLHMVEQQTGKKLTVQYEDYILAEADRLVAGTPVITDPVPLETGISDVLEALKREKSGIT